MLERACYRFLKMKHCKNKSCFNLFHISFTFLLLDDHENVDQEGEDDGVENQAGNGRAAIDRNGEEATEDSLYQAVHEGRGNDQEEDRGLERVHNLGVH